MAEFFSTGTACNACDKNEVCLWQTWGIPIDKYEACKRIQNLLNCQNGGSPLVTYLHYYISVRPTLHNSSFLWNIFLYSTVKISTHQKVLETSKYLWRRWRWMNGLHTKLPAAVFLISTLILSNTFWRHHQLSITFWHHWSFDTIFDIITDC